MAAASTSRSGDLFLPGRVVVTGMARVASLRARSPPPEFDWDSSSVHASVDAVHGTWAWCARTCAGAFSQRETEEILRLLATLKRLQVPLISMTGIQFSKGPQQKRGGRPRPHEHH